MKSRASVIVIVPVIALLIMLLTGCKSKQPALQTIPIKEVTTVELQTIDIPGDSAVLRLPVDRLTRGDLTGGLPGGIAVSPNGLKLLWELRNGSLKIKAENPPDVITYPVTTITKEVPVEVVREVPINHLYPWQKALMWLGAIFLALMLIKLARRQRAKFL